MLHQIGFGVRIERFCHRHEFVCRVHAAAGKDELARHEFVSRVALAEQDFGNGARAVDQDQGRRILRPHIGRREIALDLVHPLDEAVHPLEPVRLHVAHYWLSSISLEALLCHLLPGPAKHQ
jgi:hypothetical protein